MAEEKSVNPWKIGVVSFTDNLVQNPVMVVQIREKCIVNGKIVERIKMITGDYNPFFINGLVIFDSLDFLDNHLAVFYKIFDETLGTHIYKPG